VLCRIHIECVFLANDLENNIACSTCRLDGIAQSLEIYHSSTDRIVAPRFRTRIAIFGGTAPLIAAAFVGAGHPTYVALYMIVIVAVCLAVYFTLPETGSKTLRATVSLNDPEIVEGELTAREDQR
jgi:hypothetical protein